MQHLSLLLTVGLLACLAACDSIGVNTRPPGPGPAPQTRVLRLTLDPDTVVVGDTTLITVAIEDSLDARFRYDWIIPSGSTQ